MPTHHEWVQGQLETMREERQPSNASVERLRSLAGPRVPESAVREGAVALEQAELKLRERAETRTRRKVLEALGEHYRNGKTPSQAPRLEGSHEGEVHPHSDHAHRAKYGRTFTTF